MNRRHLEFFAAVARWGTMSEAARRLAVTQSSVSQAVAEIERTYHVRLFDRLSRGLYLTEVGRELLVYANRILALQSEMEDFLQDPAQARRLRVGVTATVGTCVISPLLAQFRARFSGTCPEVSVTNTQLLEEGLLNGDLDVGLCEGRIQSPALRRQPVIQDRLVLICRRDHPFSGRAEVPLEELGQQALILRERGSGTRAQLEHLMLERGVPLHVAWDSRNTEAILNAVVWGHGISVISRRLVENFGRREELWTAEIADADLRRTFDLVFHKDRTESEELSGFAQLCREWDRLAQTAEASPEELK